MYYYLCIIKLHPLYVFYVTFVLNSRFLENLATKPSRTLYICHATRNDIILGFLGEYQRRRIHKINFESALLICGRKEKYFLNSHVEKMMEGYDDIPILYVEYSTHEALEKIHEFTPKLNIDDSSRVVRAVEHYGMCARKLLLLLLLLFSSVS